MMTSLSLNDRWCVSKNVNDLNSSMEQYTLWHYHKDDYGEAIGYDEWDEDEQEGLFFENCPECDEIVPDHVSGFFALCLWNTS